MKTLKLLRDLMAARKLELRDDVVNIVLMTCLPHLGVPINAARFDEAIDDFLERSGLSAKTWAEVLSSWIDATAGDDAGKTQRLEACLRRSVDALAKEENAGNGTPEPPRARSEDKKDSENRAAPAL
jgi:hypothetical protein